MSAKKGVLGSNLSANWGFRLHWFPPTVQRLGH